MPTEKEILSKKENAKQGWILEVDLEYPPELHNSHNAYPLAPEKEKIKREWMSVYQTKLVDELKVDMNEEKLVLTLQDKENYVLHYKNLQLYLKFGMKLKKVHRTLEFDQECCMEPYIRMNTEFRKQAKNYFEKKLMNNSVFGKTMENLRKPTEIKVVRSDETEKIRKLTASPLYAGFQMFTNHISGTRRRKEKLVLNKPVYVGMTIFDNSKILMYDFYYSKLKRRYGENCELIYTDTDSLLLNIQTDDVYKNIEKNKDLYDTCDYPEDTFFTARKTKRSWVK